MVSENELRIYILENYEYSEGKLVRKYSKTRWKAKTIVGEYVGKRGYKTIYILGKRYPTHRLIFLHVNGYLPEFIDHINRIKTDNRIENLREISKEENALNMTASHRDSKLGVLGVTQKDSGKYIAQFRGARLGEFNSIKEAKRVYDEIKSRTIKISI